MDRTVAYALANKCTFRFDSPTAAHNFLTDVRGPAKESMTIDEMQLRAMLDITPTQAMRNGKLYECETTLKSLLPGKTFITIWGACRIICDRKVVVHVAELDVVWEWDNIRVLFGDETLARLRISLE
eukprot:7063108-Karenia_brevis.AAC.1